jgi:hypothetical protein
MDYLLDSNIFIEAKRRYYGMDICPGFWEWLDTAHGAGRIASIIPVGEELADGNDELSTWSKERSHTGWFLDISDASTQHEFMQILARVTEADYSDYAKDDFFRGADPWLIAKAKVIGATVVTHEVFNPNTKKKVPIPNICREFGVPYLNTFDLLREQLARFELSEVD